MDLQAAGLASDVDGEVATVTLDRPEVRNAQTPRMWRALAAIGEHVPDEVRVVVVQGRGQSFSAGLDRAMLDPSGGDGQETVAGLLALPDEEASAAIEQFLRDTTPPPAPAATSRWLRAGLFAGTGRDPGAASPWGDAERWGST